MAEPLYRILYADGKIGEAWTWERILVLVRPARRLPPRYYPTLVFREPEPVPFQDWEYTIREAILIARVEREQAGWSAVWDVIMKAAQDAP